jgi:hypothetical protein
VAQPLIVTNSEGSGYASNEAISWINQNYRRFILVQRRLMLAQPSTWRRSARIGTTSR